jgi:hypothetical protein
MRFFSLALIAVLAIGAPVLAQCSTLTVTGTINAGQTITVDVSGATPDSLVFLAVGEAGTTTFPFPGGGLTLGVEAPMLILPIGVSDASGHVALSVEVPANIPAGVIQDHTFTAQAITPSFTFMPMFAFSFCVSNTASLVSGAGS